MSIEALIASHLRLASESLKAARALAAIGNRNAAYQAQQGVEQMLLALVQSEDINISRSQHHQLETIRRSLPDTSSFRPDFEKLTWLESYATAYRYPRTRGGISEPPDATRLASALAASDGLLSRLAAHFGVDLDPTCRTTAFRSDPPRRS